MTPSSELSSAPPTDKASLQPPTVASTDWDGYTHSAGAPKKVQIDSIAPTSATSKYPDSEDLLRRKTPYGTIDSAFKSSLAPQTTERRLKHSPQDPSVQQQPRYNDPLAQAAATVIQYPNQPYGPTADGTAVRRLYGPYWHDGTFVPYHPHAVRDPRYYSVHPHFHPVQPSPIEAQRTFATYAPTYPPPPVVRYILPFTEPIQDAQAVSLNTVDRERIFQLGLTTYRELLAYLHNSRQAPGSRSPSIYPRPPVSSSAQSPVTTPRIDTPQINQADASAYRAWGPLSAEIFAEGALHISTQTSIVQRSANALRSLNKICTYANWQWVDGLNLGGCLAYGLGDYRQAHDLYTRVLQLDDGHVEAESNLAATLLALDRRADAELHWTRVIKQAPNYFEAVEHLVGLLCSNSRAKDAVSVIEHVEYSLRLYKDDMSVMSRSPVFSEQSDSAVFDHDLASPVATKHKPASDTAGFGTSGYAIPGSDNSRIISLVHAKGNMMYSLGDNAGAAKAFEDVVLIATGRAYKSIRDLVHHILHIISGPQQSHSEPVLLHPDQAIRIASRCFPPAGELPGLAWLPSENSSLSRKSATLTTSNSLLSLAKIFQDGMVNSARGQQIPPTVSGVREIIALYYLSLSLQPSPSTANNVGILLAGVQQSTTVKRDPAFDKFYPGILPGSGVALALAYYNYGLNLDSRHAHLYTNLGSLLKDIGQLDAAIEMYKRAVSCDGKFDIALANLANAVKDKGHVSEAIDYYNRAVQVNPSFAEAVCGLANALNSICKWASRGGVSGQPGVEDRWHVDGHGKLLDATITTMTTPGWMQRVSEIVIKQLSEGEDWGAGCLSPETADAWAKHIVELGLSRNTIPRVQRRLLAWSGKKGEGARSLWLVERLSKHITWRWYHYKHSSKKDARARDYQRPRLPSNLAIPSAPTVLPFHTFTSPLSARQVRMISQRNAYRISTSTLRAPWLPNTVYPPPSPPNLIIKVGYVSSDFNNHPLAHLMQSVFGMHDRTRVEAYCYATTASDNSDHRKQIETEAPHFLDVSAWSTDKTVERINQDGIHILVNLNGYTRGARNEIFAARPAPISMSFMGFAGTMGAEWCDYLLADETSIPPSSVRNPDPKLDILDQIEADTDNDAQSWVYGEKIVFCRSTFFCCDHRQSAPDSDTSRLTWADEQTSRWKLRRDLFPTLPDRTVILANFNQLYKIEPTTFRSWLRILARCPNAVLWLLRFPDLGEANLIRTAHLWAGPEVASRVLFTDVAPKSQHIARAKCVDLFLDTPECNAHTTAADVLWSGCPLLTFPRHEYKLCSRMAASILRGALPRSPPEERARMDAELIVYSMEAYETSAISLASSLVYEDGCAGSGRGRLMDLRRILTDARWTSELFDTKRWTEDLEDAYAEVWRRWVAREGGNIWLDRLPQGCSRSKSGKGLEQPAVKSVESEKMVESQKKARRSTTKATKSRPREARRTQVGGQTHTHLDQEMRCGAEVHIVAGGRG